MDPPADRPYPWIGRARAEYIQYRGKVPIARRPWADTQVRDLGSEQNGVRCKTLSPSARDLRGDDDRLQRPSIASPLRFWAVAIPSFFHDERMSKARG